MLSALHVYVDCPGYKTHRGEKHIDNLDLNGRLVVESKGFPNGFDCMHWCCLWLRLLTLWTWCLLSLLHRPVGRCGDGVLEKPYGKSLDSRVPWPQQSLFFFSKRCCIAVGQSQISWKKITQLNNPLISCTRYENKSLPNQYLGPHQVKSLHVCVIADTWLMICRCHNVGPQLDS